MRKDCCGLLASYMVLLCALCQAESLTDAQLIRLRDGFEGRVAAMLEAERGKVFVPAEVEYNWRGEGNHFARNYCRSVTRFAMISFLLNDQVDEANRALREMCKFFFRERQTMLNPDSFYWAHELYVRIYEFFNTRTPLKVTRLTRETEDLLLRMMWEWCNAFLTVEDVQLKIERETWYYHSSENHVGQEHAAAWGFTQILKRVPAYTDRKFEDGHTAAELCTVLEDWHEEFFRERARRGLLFEVASPGYNFRTLVGLYNVADLSEDRELRELAEKFLTLWWATWAQDQIDGVRGGGKARIRGWKALTGAATARNFTWFYFGQGEPMNSSTESLVAATSDYRLPLIVIDLAMDTEGRGVYEVQQRRMGLARGEHNRPPDSWFRTDFGGLLRYLYCTPEFIIGTNMREARPAADWHLGSSQSIWHGVVFQGDINARIVPKCANTSGDTFNEQWSVQSKGALIAQKLRTHDNAKEMQVWISSAGLSPPLEDNGWVFVESAGAYAGIKVVSGGYHWSDSPSPSYKGKFLVCDDEWSPVLIESGRKAKHAGFTAFRNAVKANPLTFSNGVLRYQELQGSNLTLYTDQSRSPEINGQTVNYAPAMVLDSPFVQSKWLSGLVRIAKGNRYLILDFDQ